jgi:leucine-zipper-like transcriptional regulator 1
LYDVWSSQNGLVWKKIADSLDFLGKNITGNVTSFNGRIWVVGGGYYRHPDTAIRWTNKIYSSADGANWRQEPDGPWKGRQYADVCVWDNRLWMIGGHRGGNLAEIWYMNKNGEWIEYTPPNLFTARHASAVGLYNNKLVIACGDYNNECWVIEKN